MSVLYGIQRVFLEELDPTTSLPLVGGFTAVLKCAESATIEPQTIDEVENQKTCPSTGAVLANQRVPESWYGYDITLTDNEWNKGVFALINGFESIASINNPDVVFQVVTPFIGEGLKFKPFRMIIFAEAWEGDDVVSYEVFIFNKCRGSLTTIELSQDFTQIEYNIRAREATSAGLPVMAIGTYVGSEPPDTLDDIKITNGIMVETEIAGTRAKVMNVKVENKTATK